MNNGFPIFELTITLYIIQYLLAALFGYHFNRYMAIPEDDYVHFTLFAILAFTAGLFSLKSKLSINQLSFNDKSASKLGRLLLIIGFLCKLAIPYSPNYLISILHFFEIFQAIGVYALVFSNHKFDKLLILVTSFLILIDAILSSTFIHLICFVLFLGMFLSYKYKISMLTKLVFLLVGFLFFVAYQGIKNEYRKQAWSNELSTHQKVKLLDSLVNKKTFSEMFTTDIKSNQSLIFTMNRLNQGWQTSKVFRHVPNQVDFEYGRDFLNDVASSLVPRFLWKNKRIVNDPERFTYYTGYKLEEDISVNIGVLGDFYLNFGKYGTIVLMFLFGLFAAWLKRFFISYFVNNNPINLIWIPFIFSFFIRPGNEFYMILNHIIKSFYVLFFIFLFIYPILGIWNRTTLRNNS